MSLVFCDSFDHYRTSPNLVDDVSSIVLEAGIWETNVSPLYIDTGARTFGFGLVFDSTGTSVRKTNFTLARSGNPSVNPTFIIGCRVKFTGFGSSSSSSSQSSSSSSSSSSNTSSSSSSTASTIFEIVWNGTNDRVQLFPDGSARLIVGGIVRDTGTYGILATGINVFHHIEIFGDYVAGTLDVYSQDIPILSYSGFATADELDEITLQLVAGTPVHGAVADDFYLLDRAGPSASSLLGRKVLIEHIIPTADTSRNDWVDEGGSNVDTADSVNEIPHNPLDLTFITTTTDGDVTAYKMVDRLPNTLNVQGIQLKRRVSNNNPAAAELSDIALNNFDVAFPIGPTFTGSQFIRTLHKVSHINPVDGTTWNVDSVNDLKWGFEADYRLSSSTSSSGSSFSSSSSSSQSSSSSRSSSSSSSESSSSSASSTSSSSSSQSSSSSFSSSSQSNSSSSSSSQSSSSSA